MTRRDNRSPEAEAWRPWYKLARWCGPHGRRAQQLRAEPLCRMCLAKGILNDGSLTSTGERQANPRRRFLVADHVIEHKGSETLFWCGELQTLCPDHHDITKQQQESRGFVAGCDLKGRPIDAAHPWNQPRP
ncbi:hypothetical protein [Brevundimonas sp.]|uniref:hypothetical protein n=1 Tax=Brevundimonas sp. TaxID=1871086 RepID=UPI002D57B80C|nr:hypothetical protein [Brevundimonas sp.]HYC66655.1 hypothetical protein [Brevundimonas sp.]